MTITLGWWTLPLAATLITWGWALLRPLPRSRGDYDFGPPFAALARSVGAVVVTLAVWLIYFAARVVALS